MHKLHKIMRGVSFLVVCIGLALLTACSQGEQAETISLRDVAQDPAPSPLSDAPPLRIAVSAIISPAETFVLYKDLLAYIERQAGKPVQLVQRETYEEINELIRRQEIDMAFVCSGAYVSGHDAFGMELLAAPRAYGKAVYHSYIIVPKDSDASSLQDLRGRRFAFTDPLSNTGKIAPTYMLARMDETPDSFFSSYVFTNSHDKSIEAVAHKLVDGAAVDSLIWEYMAATGSKLPEQTKIIFKSEPYGIPPVVVPPGLSLQQKEMLRRILLHMHETAEGSAILAKLHIEQFDPISNSMYDSIRVMDAWINKHGAE